MAKINPLVWKVALIGIPFLVAIALLPTDNPQNLLTRPGKKNNPGKGGASGAGGSSGTESGNSSTNGSANASGNTIPIRYTGGESTWNFSGTTVSNGERKAVLQNRKTGESVMVSPGQVWKQMLIISVDGNAIQVRGVGSDTSQITIGGGSTIGPSAAGTATSQTKPYMPPAR